MTKKKTLRAVDAAMNADRPDKSAIRQAWANKVQAYAAKYDSDDKPLYLTLCGAEGRDISLLAASGVIELTETGSISASSLGKVVAVEANPNATVELVARFPGLDVIEQPFEHFLQGEDDTRFPTGKHERYCRARIVNLDFNMELRPQEPSGGDPFAVFSWIKKLGALHGARPRKDWCLCLTLNGGINWPQPICSDVQTFLEDNFNRHELFRDRSKTFLGAKLFDQINAGTANFPELTREEQQKLLMVFVPKKVAHALNGQSWRINTELNWRYGTSPNAPMVTWLFECHHDREGAHAPGKLFEKNLGATLQAPCRVDAKGRILAG